MYSEEDENEDWEDDDEPEEGAEYGGVDEPEGTWVPQAEPGQSDDDELDETAAAVPALQVETRNNCLYPVLHSILHRHNR